MNESIKKGALMMQYRVDQKTGNKLSILGFGCMRFPKNLGATDMQKTEMLIKKAINEGINYFDTAYIYGGSEEALGQVLLKNNLREKVYIATKLPLMICRSVADFDKYFNIELERLKTDYIDYYLMHMITDVKLWEKLCSWGIEDWIKEKKKSGKIKQIGFSFHGKRDDFLELLDAYDWEFCQIQYNYSDENYQAGVTGLKKAAEKGIPVIIMEPLLGGKLATGLPPSAVALFKQANSELSPAAWALRWLWNQPEVTLLLSGMNDSKQLEENIRIANDATPNMLTEQENETYRKVISAFSASYKVHCTGCNYCMSCPHGVNIPACFAAYNTYYSISKGAGIQQYVMSTGGMSDFQSYASHCKKCGKCEKHCPQNIEIIKSLEAVSKKMEPIWYKPAMSIARKVMRNNKKLPKK